ncbi:putative NAD-binding Rossmann fold oxidoreductase family protein [Rosellinia necatrix]|uniref:Putative NAD-binding Rossmann fold oxidoreductase family protein n=1 Tax=Rosellinia necatrix TaxID=77044 RepID=A0A1S8ABD1_ROSNE|nr:putative NAD-binding Rossmann fold oxidoreductase family protein [Rosellinia necatrix]
MAAVETSVHPKKLNVGVVGIGRIGREHARNVLHKVHRANLLVACSPAEGDLRWGAEELAPCGVQVVKTFDELIETPGLDAILIASPTKLHSAQAHVAINKGIHVLIEKPVCATIDEVIELVKRSEASPETKVMVAFVRRFDADYKEAYAAIEKGAIGRPLVVRSQSCEEAIRSPWYTNYLRGSGGIFVDSVIHDIDLSLKFLGDDSQPKSVSAVGVSAVHTDLEQIGDADNAVGVCEFWDGRIAYYYNSRITTYGFDNQTEIFGTEGKISVNLQPRRSAVEIMDKDKVIKSGIVGDPFLRYEPAYLQEVVEWVDAIMDNKPVPVPLRSSITSLRVATALQKALATGQKILFTRDGIPTDVSEKP